MVDREPLRMGERPCPRDLPEHLPLARALHLEGVEVARQLVFVPRQELHLLDGVVDLLGEFVGRRRGRGGQVALDAHARPSRAGTISKTGTS
jgi:hypothetical protein